MELLTPVINSLNGAALNDGSTQTAGTGGSSFDSVLGQIMKQTQESPGTTVNGEGGVVSSVGLAELLSAAIGKDAGAFFQRLEEAAGQGAEGGSTKQGAASAAAGVAKTAADGTGAEGAGLDTGTQVESLLAGLLALVAMKMANGGKTGGTATSSDAASQNAQAAALNGLVSPTSAGKEKGAARKGESASSVPTQDDTSKPDDVTLAQTLALLIFESLQTVAGTQDQALSAPHNGTEALLGKGGAGAAGALSSAEGKASDGGAAVNNAAEEALEAIENGQAAADQAAKAQTIDANDPVGQLLAAADRAAKTERVDEIGSGGQLLAAVSNPADSSSGEKTVGQTRISLLSLGQAGDANNLTMVIKGAFYGGTQNQGSGGESGTESLLMNGATSGQGGSLEDDASVTIVKDLASLIESREGSPSHNSGGDKGGSSDAQGYPLATGNDASPASAAAQENGTAPGQAGSTAAVERFEQIVGQLSARPASHDLLVRLDMGDEEHLVLGLKDLGQSVTVEVRASNQGMINLLESQRDVIVRHLEGRDIHTNIVIDPNASATPEKRERRETRQARVPTAPAQDEEFGTFLESFV